MSADIRAGDQLVVSVCISAQGGLVRDACVRVDRTRVESCGCLLIAVDRPDGGAPGSMELRDTKGCRHREPADWHERLNTSTTWTRVPR